MRVIYSIFFYILILSLVWVIGCGGDGGTVVNPGITPAPTTPAPNPTTPIPESSTVIGSNGGTIEINNQSSSLYGVKVEIPQGALSSNTNISISEGPSNIALPSNNYQKVGKVIDLQPSGTDFANPVFITIPFDKSINLNDIVIVSYDATTGEWDVPGFMYNDTQKNTIQISSNHFSSFFGVIADKFPYADTGFYQDSDPNISGQDVTRIKNFGTGACFGFSAYSRWHFLNKKQIVPFYDAFNDATAKNVVAETFNLQNKKLLLLADRFAALPFQLVPHIFDIPVAKNLHTALSITKKPKCLSLCGPGGPLNFIEGTHSVLVYKWDNVNKDFIIYDSNFHGPRKIHFDGLTLSDPDYIGQPGSYNYSIFLCTGTENTSFLDGNLEAIFDYYYNNPVNPPLTEDYYPLDTGWKWNYKQTSQDPNGTWTNTYEQSNLNGTFQNNSVIVQKWIWDTGKISEYYYQKTTDIIWLGWKSNSNSNTYKYEPFSLYLKYPLSTNSSWEDNFNQINVSTQQIDICKGNRIILAKENISVPAGNFTNCYKVKWEREYTWPNNTQTNRTDYWWYAPDVGLVKWTTSYEDNRYSETILTGYTTPSGQKVGNTDFKVNMKNVKEGYEPINLGDIIINR